jgi:hypothetical protein
VTFSDRSEKISIHALALGKLAPGRRQREFGHEPPFVIPTNRNSSFRRNIGLHYQGSPMVSKCSNSSCSASFLYLHSGKVFRFDVPGAETEQEWGALKQVKKIEFFWLCESCVTKFTFVTDPGVGPRVVALQPRSRAAAAGL